MWCGSTRSPIRPPPLAAVGAGRDPGADGCRREQGEQRFVACERVIILGVARLDHAPDPPRRAFEHALDFAGFGWRKRKEPRARTALKFMDVGAIECERVKVQIQVERRSRSVG